MNDENAWIDEIIMKHKNQLKVLKDSNNEITNLNPNISKSLNNFQKFYQSDFTNTMDLHSEFKNNEIKLQKKLQDKINQLENLKNQEITLMNEKIKNFEILLDDNSKNYVKDLNSLRNKLEEYRNKIDESNKYVETVNFFLKKIDILLGNKKEDIYDINQLQNKFVDIENYISKFVNLSKLEIEEKNEVENNNNNENEDNIKIPNFQNKYIDEGVNNYQRKNSDKSFDENLNNNTEKYFEELNNRLGKLENKYNENKIKIKSKKNSIKRNKSAGRMMNKNPNTNIIQTNRKSKQKTHKKKF